MKFIAQAVCTIADEAGFVKFRLALQEIGSCAKIMMDLQVPEFAGLSFFGRYKVEFRPEGETVAPAEPTEYILRQECEELAEMLVAKNKAYGDSALDPVRIFSQADPVEQIRVRLDDKLSRLARGQAAGEDVILDLLGYLVLLRIAMRKEKGEG